MGSNNNAFSHRSIRQRTSNRFGSRTVKSHYPDDEQDTDEETPSGETNPPPLPIVTSHRQPTPRFHHSGPRYDPNSKQVDIERRRRRRMTTTTRSRERDLLQRQEDEEEMQAEDNNKCRKKFEPVCVLGGAAAGVAACLAAGVPLASLTSGMGASLGAAVGKIGFKGAKLARKYSSVNPPDQLTMRRGGATKKRKKKKKTKKRRNKMNSPNHCCAGPGCPEWKHCINVLGDGKLKPKSKKTLKIMKKCGKRYTSLGKKYKKCMKKERKKKRKNKRKKTRKNR